MNIYTEAGLLILGTRMKRISDRFLTEVSKIYKERKIGFEPAWFPVFYLMDIKGPMSLTEIANELEVSHSAVSQTIAQLEKKKLVEMIPNDADARVKLMYFTIKGKKLLDEVHQVWKAMLLTMNQLFSEEEKVIFMEILSNLEEKVASGFLSLHTLETLSAVPLQIKCSLADDNKSSKIIKWANEKNVDYSFETEKLMMAVAQQNSIAGFAAFTESEGNLHLNYVFVDPSYRRLGVASKLLQAVSSSYFNDTNGCFQLKNPGMELIGLLVKLNYSFKVN